MDPTIIAIIGVLLLLTVILLYNMIVARKNEVERAWASVITYERQKNQTIPKLESITGDFKEYEQGLQTQIVKLRNAVAVLDPQQVGQTDALAEVERATRSLLGNLKVAVEAYPAVTAASVVRNLMAEIARQQENIAAAIVIFNRAVERHNNSIEQFPGSLVNATLNHRSRITPFHDSAASAGFEYKLP